MATNLVNKAFSHLVTIADSIIPFVQILFITDKDLFTYKTTMSRYTIDCFLGIMIDIGALKRSIIGYSQFLAL